jgi:hypothetical protein
VVGEKCIVDVDASTRYFNYARDSRNWVGLEHFNYRHGARNEKIRGASVRAFGACMRRGMRRVEARRRAK